MDIKKTYVGASSGLHQNKGGEELVSVNNISIPMTFCKNPIVIIYYGLFIDIYHETFELSH